MKLFDDYTPESIKNEILEGITETDTREGSFANNLVSPVAYKIWELLQSLNACIPIAFVDETSGKYIDKRAAEFGLERKDGTKATATMTFSGNVGTVIAAESIFLTADGYEYTLDESVTLDSNGEGYGTVTAVSAGEDYNTNIDTIVNIYKSINGLSSYTNSTAAVGGTDTETDSAFVQRLYEYWQMPSTSGNIYDYKRWAKAVDGVGEAKIFPVWNGNGTVKVVICNSNMGVCSLEIIRKCAAYIETMRPIGATVTVESAEEKAITITATLELDGSRTLSEVKTDIERELEGYLKDIAFSTSSLLYNQIGYIILSTEGVTDFTALTVNSGTSNIPIAANEIAVLNSLAVVSA